jgi:hypothetical protein
MPLRRLAASLLRQAEQAPAAVESALSQLVRASSDAAAASCLRKYRLTSSLLLPAASAFPPPRRVLKC